jgi:hypothetical protein
MSVRNIPFLGILMLPIAAYHLQAILHSSSSSLAKTILLSSERIDKDEHKRTDWLWGVGLLLLATIFIASGIFTINLSEPLVPVRAMDWVKKHKEFHGKPVFADFLAAGYLLYSTPVERVYLHALNAYYTEERLRTWIAVGRDEDGWKDKLEGIEWAFLLRGRSQLNTFMVSSSWHTLYEDSMVVVFEKTCP